MSASLDYQKLQIVFQSRPDILEGIKRASDSPGRVALFNEIAHHVLDRLHANGEPAHKKRRVDVDQTIGAVNGVKPSTTTLSDAADEPVLLAIKEISVSVPQRKKFELCFTANHLYARLPNTEAPIRTITYAWNDIEYAFYLPVPDKSQVQHNYILFPRGTYLPSKTSPPTEEPLVFTVPSTAPKEGTISGLDAGSAAAVSDAYKTLFHWAMNRQLKPAGHGVEIVSADPNKFHSMVRQAHRPNERAVHVKAFRGSKDGYLFFLENGILWGFKKPLMFIPLNRIVATSYTSVLQRTFNMVVEVFASEGEGSDEIEFSMLDQEDFSEIDEYVKRNRLQDRSMAEQRKAKLELAENRGPKKGAEGVGTGDEAGQDGHAGADGLSELQRAELEVEQKMQDEEDEEEEDYDPGSDADSDGSGESSDDDDDDDDDEDDEDEAEDGEGEGGEGGEGGYDGEGGEEEEEVEEEPEEEKPAPRPSRAPAARGWATMNTRANHDMDLDEKFDVVG